MTISEVVGSLDAPLQDYDLEQVRMYVLGIHPELRSAQIGVERAHLVLERAKVQPIPNITIGTGYTHQSQNRSDDFDLGFSLPIPVWNKNQGNIFAAQAEVHAAVNNVARVENDLVNRLATAFSAYVAARKRAERYQTAILPKARRTYELSLKAYQGGQFEYLRVLQAQRAVAEANLELVRSLGEMWASASKIAGLMLEDQWPLGPAVPAPEGPEPVPPAQEPEEEEAP
jgi:cobalt-zinc-cadmium efflux system outer membrane protein